jgi:DNA-binding NarL/FixJ family response regulator
MESDREPRRSAQRPDSVVLSGHLTLYRAVLSRWIEQSDRFRLIGEASDANAALTICARHQPDVLLLDADMPGRDPCEATRVIALRCPSTRILLLTASLGDQRLQHALDAGVAGVLTKDETPETLSEAIVRVVGGDRVLSPAVQARLTSAPSESPDARLSTRFSAISPRELETLRYIAQGLSKKQIASHMHLSIKTVDNHTTNLMNRLDLHDRVQLTRFALREGLVEL